MCEHGLDLAFRHVRGELGQEERARWEQHLGDCDGCATLERKAKAIRRMAQTAADDVPAVDWRRVGAQLHAATRRPAARTGWWLVPVGTLAAAALAIALWPETTARHAESPAQTTWTEAAATHQVLADGSRLEVAPGSRLHYEENSREAVVVRLESGALTADVVKRPERRDFVVRVGEAEVRVLGTRFTVEVGRNGAATVSVERGLVQVRDWAGTVAQLRAGARHELATRAAQATAQAQAAEARGGSGSAASGVAPAAQQVAVAEVTGPAVAPTAPAADEPVVVTAEGGQPGQPAVERAAQTQPATGQQAPKPDAHSKALGHAQNGRRHRAERAEREDAAPAKAVDPGASSGASAGASAGAPAIAPQDPPAAAVPPAAGRLPQELPVSSDPVVARLDPPKDAPKVVVAEGDTSIVMMPSDGSEIPAAGRDDVVAFAEAARDGRCAQVMPAMARFLGSQRGHDNFADVVYLQGYCLLRLGKREAGLRAWKRYEQLAPSGVWLQSVGDWTDPAPPDPSRIP